MRNTGQVYAYDDDAVRLRPIFERLKRAGARNVQVLQAGDATALAALGPRFDLVFVDAPCTGSGAWRRRPDAKWRLKPANLAQRQEEQRAILGAGRAAGASPAAVSSTSPARSCRKRTTTRSPGFWRTIRTSPRCPGVTRGMPASANEPPPSADERRDGAAPHAGPARHGRLLHRRAGEKDLRCCERTPRCRTACSRCLPSTDKCLTWKLAVLRIAFC